MNVMSFRVFSDLNNNKLATLNGGAISTLNKLITLRLHSQKDTSKMTSIQYNAFINIAAKLKNL